MEIAETIDSTTETVCIHYKTQAKKGPSEKWVDIHKDAKGKVLSVDIGCKKITAFELEILDFLQKEGKL